MKSLAIYSKNFNDIRSRSGLGRALLWIFATMRIAKSLGYPSARIIKVFLEPVKFMNRRRIALLSAATPVMTISEDDYLAVPTQELDGLAELVSYCQSLFNSKRKEIVAKAQVPTPIIEFESTSKGPRAKTPEELKPILEFASKPWLVGTAARYIGEIPVLGNVSFWHTPINDQRTGSQQFHRDMNARKQLHLFIAINDIDRTMGPFTFLPGRHSRAVNRVLKHQGGRVEDTAILKLVDEKELIRLTGPAGSAWLVNPFECFHYGGRATGKPRLALIISYTSKYESVEETNAAYRLVNRRELCDGTLMQTRLLNL